MVEIKTQFDPKLRKLIKNKKQIAIIPVGSIEQHGPHLPISTDSDIVSEVAKKYLKRMSISYFQQLLLECHLNIDHFLI